MVQNGGDEQKASETNGKPMRITSGETEICMRMMCGEQRPWASEGVQRGLTSPPRILKIAVKKGCFLSFEWEKTHFNTFDPLLEKI